MTSDTKLSLSSLLKSGIGIPILVITMMSMMILPMPPFFLDLFFTFNIVFALVLLLASIYCKRPLDFAIFPTVLLVATLLRLTLNVASTRVVLLQGHTGTASAGQVIQSFGEVVIGGNYSVGLVVFAILVVINFVVVTKGAGRVSEVSARFTLDALPGKQMAIDADLNAGIINQDQAKLRREEVAQEADFYGSMDGASKFVRGDAAAGILILVINIVGGLCIGILQHKMSFGNAVHNYALLTIGDGLVAQIPSLLLSTAAAIIVTRVSKSHDMGTEIISQLFSHPKTLLITAVIIAGLGIIPGMPHLVFLLFAAALGGGAYYIAERNKALAEQPEPEPQEIEDEAQKADAELNWDDVSQVDIVGLEVGYRLIPMVDNSQNGQLLGRIKGVRKKLSQELGFLIPAVHIRDNLDLSPNTYRIILAGVTVGEAEIFTDKFLAINPGQVFGELEGIPVKDPSFGLDAIWIDDDKREHAQTLGYTVVDPSTVIATHVSQKLQTNAAQLLGHEEVQQLLERLSQTAPKLVAELTPDALSLGAIVKVLQALLEEGVPIRDMRSIAESLAEVAHTTKEHDSLLSAARVTLSRLIVQNINGLSQDLPVMTLQPELEQLLQNSLQTFGESGGGFEPSLAEKIQTALTGLVKKQEAMGQPSLLIVQPNLRAILSGFVRGIMPNLHVLSYHEIPNDKQITIVGSVG